MSTKYIAAPKRGTAEQLRWLLEQLGFTAHIVDKDSFELPPIPDSYDSPLVIMAPDRPSASYNHAGMKYLQ
jgi:hypothetical protein